VAAGDPRCNLSKRCRRLGDPMVIDTAQEDTLLELLNTAPVVKGSVQDRFADPDAARSWQRAHGGRGTDERAPPPGQGSRRAAGRDPCGTRARVAVTAPRRRPLPAGRRRRRDRVGAGRTRGAPAGRARGPGLGGSAAEQARTAAPLRQPRVPAVPARPQQGQQRPLVLDGHLRQPDEGPPPLPTSPRDS
jgi:hypothetical protein